MTVIETAKNEQIADPEHDSSEDHWVLPKRNRACSAIGAMVGTGFSAFEETARAGAGRPG